MQTLENLFRLSNFSMEDEAEKAQWLSDIAQWLEFFSLEDTPDVPNLYRFAGQRPIDAIRPDDVVGKSLTSAEIKLFSKRFVDGFIALPEHKRQS